jgi:hypothetical protein
MAFGGVVVNADRYIPMKRTYRTAEKAVAEQENPAAKET